MTGLPDPATPLAPDAATAAFGAIFDGAVDDVALAGFLVGLASRGETAAELVAAARALRARQSQGIDAPDAIDVCGTGGDGMHSLNVSTAVAIVVAACGARVAKHGNRAASSQSGAADVLAALGVPELPEARLGACLDAVGITFLHAARAHPAMARVAGVRRRIGRRTIFNLLGPLVNPAGVRRQLVGVFDADAMAMVAEALGELGSEKAMVVHGDGFDELTVTATSRFVRLETGDPDGGEPVRHFAMGSIDPAEAGVSCWPAAALKGGDPAYNAARLRALLGGEAGAYHDIVVLNAAAALTVASDDAIGLGEAAERARAVLASGAAADTLARWVAFR